MGALIVVDCEAPLGVGAPSVDPTEFGAVDVNALREGRTETFHGADCSKETFRQFRDRLTPRMPVVFVSDFRDNDLQEVPEGIAGFVEFFDARRKKLDGRLQRALGVA